MKNEDLDDFSAYLIVEHNYEPRCEKTGLLGRKLVFGVFDQVPHKPDCAATEDG